MIELDHAHCFRKLPALVAASLMLPALAYADKNDHGRGDNNSHQERGSEHRGDAACFVRSGAKHSLGIDTLYGCGSAIWLHESLASARTPLFSG